MIQRSVWCWKYVTHTHTHSLITTCCSASPQNAFHFQSMVHSFILSNSYSLVQKRNIYISKMRPEKKILIRIKSKYIFEFLFVSITQTCEIYLLILSEPINLFMRVITQTKQRKHNRRQSSCPLDAIWLYLFVVIDVFPSCRRLFFWRFLHQTKKNESYCVEILICIVA